MSLVIVKYPGSITFDSGKLDFVTSPVWMPAHLLGDCVHHSQKDMCIVEDFSGGVHVVNKKIVEEVREAI